ncbi:hypothetical protein F511_42617 [Dorcoceras hygrometricum]|uniref:Uncharacterized protein n=1 Tax=Dorcoceras hygrometricum TaxID=472368 RepID=A0A2Z7BCZ5_9LAMI|nr:hypothetical protein F511_42617 [Dorcoceras hygrometricum]
MLRLFILERKVQTPVKHSRKMEGDEQNGWCGDTRSSRSCWLRDRAFVEGLLSSNLLVIPSEEEEGETSEIEVRTWLRDRVFVEGLLSSNLLVIPSEEEEGET